MDQNPENGKDGCKKALITGITGQDGSYLADLLIEKGYEVHGVVRRSSSLNTSRIEHLLRMPGINDRRLFLHYGDLSDTIGLHSLLKTMRFDEIYNLGAQSHVRVSFDIPEYTTDITGTGTVRLLDSIIRSGVKSRYYQASSSEMFGKVTETPQRETTPFYPRSPYACAKVFSYWMTVNYREAYGVHASNGICFNHESPRRGENFVTRKITRTLARIIAGKEDSLPLGNIDALRDWGYARDYVDAMWRMMQADQPDDYVIATGETHSIREFLAEAFSLVGRDWQEYVRIEPKFFRPTEVDCLIGDFTKAREKLGWKPQCSFKQLVRLMVEEDLRLEGLDPRALIKDRSERGSAAA